MNSFEKMREGLKNTRDHILGSLDTAFGDYTAVDDDFFDALFETLLLADVGIELSEEIVDEAKTRVREDHIKDPVLLKKVLIDLIADQISAPGEDYDFLLDGAVILMVGANGTGKTTAIGKLAYFFTQSGAKVVLAAADTFRAAASEQLRIWAERTGADFVGGREGIDPASVIYEAIDRFCATGADFLICDTAGRLQNKKNLMAELAKIDRILSSKLPDTEKKVLLVLDATTGQNAVSQAREFSKVSDISGIILNKMDGTAKGGVALNIMHSLDIPILFLGTGEKKEDLVSFNAREFLSAIFG